MADDKRGLSSMGATFAERKAAREGEPVEADAKQVKSGDVEDKAVRPSETKRRNRKQS